MPDFNEILGIKEAPPEGRTFDSFFDAPVEGEFSFLSPTKQFLKEAMPSGAVMQQDPISQQFAQQAMAESIFRKTTTELQRLLTARDAAKKEGKVEVAFELHQAAGESARKLQGTVAFQPTIEELTEGAIKDFSTIRKMIIVGGNAITGLPMEAAKKISTAFGFRESLQEQALSQVLTEIREDSPILATFTEAAAGFFDPALLASFGLTGSFIRRFLPNLGKKVGINAGIAARRAGASPEASGRIAAWTSLVAAESGRAGVALGSLGAIEGAVESETIKEVPEKALRGAVVSGALGLLLGTGAAALRGVSPRGLVNEFLKLGEFAEKKGMVRPRPAGIPGEPVVAPEVPVTPEARKLIEATKGVKAEIKIQENILKVVKEIETRLGGKIGKNSEIVTGIRGRRENLEKQLKDLKDGKTQINEEGIPTELAKEKEIRPPGEVPAVEREPAVPKPEVEAGERALRRLREGREEIEAAKEREVTPKAEAPKEAIKVPLEKRLAIAKSEETFGIDDTVQIRDRDEIRNVTVERIEGNEVTVMFIDQPQRGKVVDIGKVLNVVEKAEVPPKPAAIAALPKEVPSGITPSERAIKPAEDVRDERIRRAKDEDERRKQRDEDVARKAARATGRPEVVESPIEKAEKGIEGLSLEASTERIREGTLSIRKQKARGQVFQVIKLGKFDAKLGERTKEVIAEFDTSQEAVEKFGDREDIQIEQAVKKGAAPSTEPESAFKDAKIEVEKNFAKVEKSLEGATSLDKTIGGNLYKDLISGGMSPENAAASVEGFAKGNRAEKDAILDEAAEALSEAPKENPFIKFLNSLHKDEVGAMEVGIVAEGAVNSAVGAVRIFTKTFELLNIELINVVKRQGKEGAAFGERAERALSEGKTLAGKFSQQEKGLKKLVGFPTLKSQRAAWELQGIDWGDRKFAGIAKISSALDGTLDLNTLTTQAQLWIKGQRKIQARQGVIAENRNLVQKKPGDPVKPFKRAPEGKLFLRLATRFSHDLFRTPEGPGWEALVQGVMELNEGWTLKRAVKELSPFTKKNFRKTNMEIPRTIPNFPTHLRVPGILGDITIPLLQTHPFAYTEASVRWFAMRMGVIKEFGQIGVGGAESQFQALKNKAIEGGVIEKDVDNLMMALSGVQLDTPFLRPGTPEYELARNVGLVGNMIKSGKLTRAFIPNITEFFGNITVYGGVRRMLLGMKDVLGPKSAETAMIVERIGASTADVVNMTIDRDRYIESMARIFGNGVLRIFPTRPVWSWQEKHGAATGLRFAMDIKLGKRRGTELSRELDWLSLRWLQYSRKEATKLNDGLGSRQDYLGIAQRFAARSNTTRMTLPAEESRAINARKWQQWMWFTRYPTMSARSFRNTTKLLADSLVDFKGDPSRQNAIRLYGAALKNAQYHFGKTTAGAGAQVILAFAVGGPAGLGVLWDDVKRDPLAFLAKSWAWAQVGPILTSLGRVAIEGGVKDWWLVSAPAGALLSVVEALSGINQYRDRSWSERAFRWLTSNFAASKSVSTLFAAGGLGNKDTELDVSVSWYWKWRRENKDFKTSIGVLKSDHTGFRRSMRKFFEIQSSKNPLLPENRKKAERFLFDALRVPGTDPKRIAASMRGKKLIPQIGRSLRAGSEKEAFRRKFLEDVPNSVLRKLQIHDDILELWALSVLR